MGALPASRRCSGWSRRSRSSYALENPSKAFPRDVSYLLELEAISFERLPEARNVLLRLNLDWPTQITETEFFRRVKQFPKGKSYPFLSS